MIDTALHAAAEFGATRALQALVLAGAALDAPSLTPRKRRPLHCAAQAGQSEAAKLLLAAGASRHGLDADGRKPWHCVHGDVRRIALCELLKDRPARVAAVLVSHVTARSMVITFSEVEQSYDQAPVTHYCVEWFQGSEYRPTTEFSRMRQILEPATGFLVVDAAALTDAGNMLEEIRASLAGSSGELDHVTWQPGGHEIARLPPDTNFSVRVRAFSVAGCSDWSPQGTGRTLTEPPTRPGKPFVTRAARSSITMSWLPPAHDNGRPISMYEFRRALVPDSVTTIHDGVVDTLSWIKYQVKPSPEPSFTVAGFPPGSRLLARVRARNADGWGPWSALGGPFLATDTIAVDRVEPRSVTLRWTPPTCLALGAWEVQYRKHTGPALESQYHTVVDDIPAAPELSFSVPHLRPGTLYMFRVRPRDKFGGCLPSWARRGHGGVGLECGVGSHAEAKEALACMIARLGASRLQIPMPGFLVAA